MENKNGCSNQHPCSCPDTYCERHGKCCDCVAYHQKAGNLPICLRQTKQK